MSLTQDETLKFDADEKMLVQCRFAFTNGNVDATDIIKTRLKDILDEEVMVWQ